MSDIKKHLIFIVDDSRIQLILLEKALKKAGFSVHAFTSGYSLMSSLNHSCPSLIISDIDMPRMDGFQLIKKVREVNSKTQIPFFLISSKEDLSIQKKAEEAGAEVFIQKPFKYNTLVDIVREILGLVEL